MTISYPHLILQILPPKFIISSSIPHDFVFEINPSPPCLNHSVLPETRIDL
jgi:hypothetical protein